MKDSKTKAEESTRLPCTANERKSDCFFFSSFLKVDRREGYEVMQVGDFSSFLKVFRREGPDASRR